jgi:DegV family protein with EDD domain
MIKVVTDSTCDLPQEVIARHGISVVPLYVQGGGRSYLDGIDLSREEFYLQLAAYDPPATTAAPGPEQFCQVYDSLAMQGATEILSIHISSSLSAVVNSARLGAQEAQGAAVTVLDSRQLSLGTGFLVVSAAKAIVAGQSLPEILALLQEQILRTHVFAALDTLEFLRRSGRMNTVMAGLGTLLQIKPILRMADGQPTAERVRTRGHAFQRMIRWLSELLPLQEVALVHTHAPDRAEELRRQAQHLLPEGEIPAVNITPVIGAHIGPGAVGFACVTARRSS